MAQKKIAWNTGTGFITLNYTGQRNGTILVSSDPNNLYVERQQNVTVRTTNSAVSRTIKIKQSAKEPNFFAKGRVAFRTKDGAYFNVKT